MSATAADDVTPNAAAAPTEVVMAQYLQILEILRHHNL